VLVFVVGAFAEMSEDVSRELEVVQSHMAQKPVLRGDVSRICDIIAHDLARTHVSYYNDDAKRTKGMCRLLNRARDLIIHDPAHHGANGEAMPMGEVD